MQDAKIHARRIYRLMHSVIKQTLHVSYYYCRLPVPPLKTTLKGLIHSLKPLYGEDSQIIQELKGTLKTVTINVSTEYLK